MRMIRPFVHGTAVLALKIWIGRTKEYRSPEHLPIVKRDACNNVSVRKGGWNIIRRPQVNLVRYSLEWYKVPTIFSASWAMNYICEFHLTSGENFSPNSKQEHNLSSWLEKNLDQLGEGKTSCDTCIHPNSLRSVAIKNHLSQPDKNELIRRLLRHCKAGEFVYQPSLLPIVKCFWEDEILTVCR